MRFRGGEFSTGTKGNFQSELTQCHIQVSLAPKQPGSPQIPQVRKRLHNRRLGFPSGCTGATWSSLKDQLVMSRSSISLWTLGLTRVLSTRKSRAIFD